MGVDQGTAEVSWNLGGFFFLFFMLTVRLASFVSVLCNGWLPSSGSE